MGTAPSQRRILEIAAILSAAGSLTCGGRLTLPTPDVAGTTSSGDSVVYTFPNGETLSVPTRDPPASPSTDPRPCPASLYLELGSETYVSASVAEEQRRRHDAGEPPILGDEAELFRTARMDELTDRRRDMGYATGARFLARLASDEKTADGIPYAKTITCDLTLSARDRVFHPLRFAGPGSSYRRLTCECTEDPPQCGRLSNPFTTAQLRSMAGSGTNEPAVLTFSPTNCGVSGPADAAGAISVRCDPVTNVTVRGCAIDGRISASSIGGDMARYSSPRADHVDRLRESAAQHLTFSNLRITGKYRTPIHLLPGVHHVTVEDSTIVGGYVFSAVYLPADGGWVTLRNNTIFGHSAQWDLDVTEPSGGRREVIAIDASEHNRIIRNHIQRIRYGGIYLYRNCGERSSIRNRPPQYNQIIDNVFDYGGETPSHPAIFVGSRDDLPVESYIGVKKYCNDDLGPDGRPYPGNDRRYPWDSEVVPNSSESNDDWAGHNVVAQNVFAAFGSSRGVGDFIRLSEKAKALDTNWVDLNRLAADAAGAIALMRRGAGCAVYDGVRNGYRTFVLDGDTIDMFWSYATPIRLACGAPLICRDGELSPAPARPCALQVHTDNCLLSDENRDCIERNACPAAHSLRGIQVACNLEHGQVSNAQLDAVPMDWIRVVRPSDVISEGSCWSNGTAISEGHARILDARVGTSVVMGCREHDRNGADCHVRARYYCRDDTR